MKRGLSQVVSAMVIILLTIAAVAVVWTMINNNVVKKLDDSKNCYGIFEEVTLNNDWTCFNRTSNKTQFLIKVEDIELDAVLVSIVNGENTESKSIRIKKENTSIENITFLGETSNYVELPGKEAGRTYEYSGFDSKPSKISIAPIINGNICDATSRIENFEYC